MLGRIGGCRGNPGHDGAALTSAVLELSYRLLSYPQYHPSYNTVWESREEWLCNPYIPGPQLVSAVTSELQSLITFPFCLAKGTPSAKRS